MKYLFDTHIFLWALDNHPLLSAEARYLLDEAMVEGCILVTHDDNVAKYGLFVRRV